MRFQCLMTTAGTEQQNTVAHVRMTGSGRVGLESRSNGDRDLEWYSNHVTLEKGGAIDGMMPKKITLGSFAPWVARPTKG